MNSEKKMWCDFTKKYERYWIETSFPNGMGGGNRLHYIDEKGEEITWFDMKSKDEVVEKPIDKKMDSLSIPDQIDRNIFLTQIQKFDKSKLRKTIDKHKVPKDFKGTIYFSRFAWNHYRKKCLFNKQRRALKTFYFNITDGKLYSSTQQIPEKLYKRERLGMRFNYEKNMLWVSSLDLECKIDDNLKTLKPWEYK